MTARPDVPDTPDRTGSQETTTVEAGMSHKSSITDTPDRTDAIARANALHNALCVVVRSHELVIPGRKGWCSCGHQARTISQREQHLVNVFTDDPAAIAALAAEWWERHPEAVLTAGVDAGVLAEDRTTDFVQYMTGWREVTP